MTRTRGCLVTAGALAVALLGTAAVAARGDDATAGNARMEAELAQRVNGIRREHGLTPLQRDAALARTARDYSCRMATERFFGHRPPDGSTLADRVRATGKPFRVIGENLAVNVNAADPVAAAVDGWMTSPTHRDNILSREFTETGVGICRRDAGYYFTQLFLRPPS